jgi:hypothetical protein
MLASTQKITAIEPIEGADNIVSAKILGWQVIIKKDEYQVGDLVTYVQIDTKVPETEMFEFLRPRDFRVRTIKLRNSLSQGLILPHVSDTKEGKDVSEYWGIIKYEKPDNNPKELKTRKPKTFWGRVKFGLSYGFLYVLIPSLKPKTRSKFPTDLVSITDEERIQNIPQVLNNPATYYASYKLDGSSITIINQKYWLGSRLRICSRRFELHDKHNDWYKAVQETQFKKEIDKLVKVFNTRNIIVQGELIGPKFNGNHHGLKKPMIKLFNIFVNGKKLTPPEFFNVCINNSIPNCPLFNTFVNDSQTLLTVEDLLRIATIKDLYNTNVPAEGLVFRSQNGDVSFKVINNEYLLKKKE